jgi:uncharacterized protein YyaL (SSP411 family)
MRGQLDSGTLDSAAVRIGQRFDIFFGGPVGTMKFPSVTQLDVLWRAFLRSGTPQFMQLVSTSLDNMLLGGLCDHIGGGFARYCTDERWMVPHFEKMLYDNAMLLDLMVSVWQCAVPRPHRGNRGVPPARHDGGGRIRLEPRRRFRRRGRQVLRLD